MNHTEFSNRFDVLFNNLMSNAAPGINEYEKSVLLTKAQDEIIKNYFNPKGNKYSEGFDNSPKRQIDFSNLLSISTGVEIRSRKPFDSRSQSYRLPKNILLIVNETVTTNTGAKQVVPISYEEYSRCMSKPYKEPLKYHVWRLITGTNDTDTVVELIPKTGEIISEYFIRYIRKPKPIILADLAEEYDGISIDGVNTISECELNPAIHEEILQRAVELAKIVYTGDSNGILQIGQRSE